MGSIDYITPSTDIIYYRNHVLGSDSLSNIKDDNDSTYVWFGNSNYGNDSAHNENIEYIITFDNPVYIDYLDIRYRNQYWNTLIAGFSEIYYYDALGTLKNITVPMVFQLNGDSTIRDITVNIQDEITSIRLQVYCSAYNVALSSNTGIWLTMYEIKAFGTELPASGLVISDGTNSIPIAKDTEEESNVFYYDGSTPQPLKLVNPSSIVASPIRVYTDATYALAKAYT